MLRKTILLTAIIITSATDITAQDNGFVSTVKGWFSSQVQIGNYTFKDGSEYSGELRHNRPYGKGKTVFKNGNVYDGEYVKGKREGYGIFQFTDG